MSELIVESKTVEQFNLADFLSAFQEAVKDGFELDLTKNETWPQKFGDHYFVVLTKSRRPRGRPEGSVATSMTPIPDRVIVPTVESELTPEEKAAKTEVAEEKAPKIVESEEKAPEVKVRAGRRQSKSE